MLGGVFYENFGGIFSEMLSEIFSEMLIGNEHYCFAIVYTAVKESTVGAVAVVVNY